MGRKYQAGARGDALRSQSWWAVIAMILLLLTVSMLAVGCSGPAAPPQVQAWGAAQARFDTPVPTPTVDPLVAKNTPLGCAPNGPAPLPAVVTTGTMPGSSAPAPNEIALTFDDGPTPYTTPPILAVLEQTHTPATFFVEGQYIHQWPNLLQREWNDGFAIALHSWDHPLMSKLTPDQLQHQFGDTLREFRAILGAHACVWLWRPPYADYNKQVLTAAASYGLTTVTWDDSSDDWDRPGVDKIVENVLSQAHPGAIVLMHDGPALRDETAAALPLILAGLTSRRLVPVTLPKLLADGHYTGVTLPTATLPTATP